MSVIWIGYTTLYREGGPKFARAAETMRRAKEAEASTRQPKPEVRCERIESKLDFVQAMQRIKDSGQDLAELHFIGHSGMYGPMFRTAAMPEQFSPYEWRTLELPFAPDGEAFFHACRSARWFAPFFARTFNVPASGYHWYTTVSLAPTRFKWEGPGTPPDTPLYIIGCKGKKSHGAVGALKKYAGMAPAETMQRFLPEDPGGDPSYDAVAPLYAEVFEDIGVREVEWNWLARQFDALPGKPRVLDIGCGNGALLRKLSGRIASGTGIDFSPVMIELAAERARMEHPNLQFQTVREPKLPFPDASFDVVTSLLSFRYLDWDPIMNEIRRVLAPGGRIMIVDMVTAPVRVKELPQLAISKVRTMIGTRKHRTFHRALRKLVSDPRWHKMLSYNPIRAEHEMKWYLESRFPGQQVERLDIGVHNRVLAFDSGPLQPGTVPPQSYP
jgi:ubiquinone/menaquinone biosynthesis C-methylase UbiE